jgi:glycosyltransferase involved in cell wall biosynthesis
MKCLWISRDQPFPPDAGDKIYSAKLATALAEAGVAVSFLGFAAATGQAPAASPVHWLPVTGAKRTQGRALFSRLPIAAAIHDTAAYRQILDAQLQEQWDAIIFDSYGSGWALKHYLATRRPAANQPVLVHVSHNQEGSLWRDMVGNSQAGPLKKLALWQNWLKVRALERFVLRHVDLTTAISDEDAAAFAALAPRRPTVVITPGYSGASQPERLIDADCPKRVVLIGSFRWVVKQENLRQFLDLADEAFHRHGIAFDVIGDVPASLRAELEPGLKATVFHGFVDDVAPYFARARLAVVPEVIGGGFKLKFLDYIFARLPVATIAAAAAGLPPAIRAHLLSRCDLADLVATIIARIDRLDALNAMQQGAFAAAGQLYQWCDRGNALREAIVVCQQARAGAAKKRPANDYRMEAS